MRFCRLDATFGRLEHRSLDFSPGLNIIEAPNESGKSTLAAFLRAMLYGFPARERGTLAEKNRYAPWSGSPMQGTLELWSEAYGDVTLRRDTPRAGSPMERFAATRIGAADSIPGLSAADCGELLLGVPREVYERSAFIRQSGLAVEASAELERRVAALVTTGEEGVSYTDAAASLKKQLNLRRANSRNGKIPALEREIEADEAALAEINTLLSNQKASETALDALCEEETALRGELAAHELADRQEQFALRERAKRSADEAAREARVFRRMLADQHIPPRETLEENRVRLRAVEDLERQRRAARQRRADAELALSQFDAKAKPSLLRPVAWLYAALLILCAALVPAVLLLRLPIPHAALYASAVGVVLFTVLLLSEALRAKEKRRERARERDALDRALDEEDAACLSIKEEIDRVLLEIYAAVPAGDAVSAAAFIHENLARYDMLAQMEAEAQRLRTHCEALPQPDLSSVPARPVERPARSREAACAALDDAAARHAELRSQIDFTAGRLRAMGSAEELTAALAGKLEALRQATAEYDALMLAMETLEHANAELQSRFSPELGKRAAEYFRRLTGGRHDAVLLDRAFHAMTSELGDAAAHDAALLSQGAGDQLYLAVRLALCDMVLPEERHIPLVLDDALTSFDDERCKAALELLDSLSQSRQILLLTCQSREAAYLGGRANVTVTTL